jgi:hypothetical protein
MAPIRGSTRRTRARLDRQAALRNEFEETFGISADGHDLSQFIDHSDDDDFNEEDDNANDTQIGQRLANLRDNFNPENIRKCIPPAAARLHSPLNAQGHHQKA